MLVVGDAGVGKSRLVAAAAEVAADVDVQVFLRWCLQLSQGVPFLPMVDVLRALGAADEGRLLKAAMAECPPFVAEEVGRLMPELGPSEDAESLGDSGPETGDSAHIPNRDRHTYRRNCLCHIWRHPARDRHPDTSAFSTDRFRCCHPIRKSSRIRPTERFGRIFPGRIVKVSIIDPTALRPTFPIRTPRLALRPLTVADTDALLDYRSRDDVARYVPFEPMTPDVIAERLITHWARTEFTDEGQAITLGIEEPESGQLVGDVVLFWHSRVHAGGEVGYVINPVFGGRGYATEAVDAMLRLGFDGLGLHRIVARIDERNEPSARLAQRLGMRLEARLVENEFFKGEWTTELDFAILATEWRAGRQ